MLPLAALAQASLFIAPSSGVYKVGEEFSTLINVNSGGQPINAASTQINFDNMLLEVTELGFSRSIFTMWTEEPVASNAAGTIRFSGGLPNPGFDGASGAILRVNFRARAAGSAAVLFNSGAVLANDGKGTNILSSLNGATYNIVAAAKKIPETAPPSAVEKGEKIIAAPVITEWPGSLQSGDTLSIRGLGYPKGKILIFVQKGTEDPSIDERYAGDDGRFSYTYSKTVEAGFYRVWAKNVAADGVISAPSDAAYIEVTQPLFFRIGTIALNYASIVITLSAFIVLMLLIIIWSWLRIRKWHERYRKDISQTEFLIHKAFDLLKEDIEKQVKFLEKARSQRQLTEEEERVVEYLKKDLDDAEKLLRKELEGMEKKI